MEVETKIDKKNNLRIHTVKGHLSKDKLFAKLLDLYSNSDFQTNMNALWDVRCTDLSSVVMSDVIEACDFVRNQWRGDKTIRVAFLVGSEVDYTLAAMYETLSTGNPKFKIQIFRDIEKSIDWLTK